MNKTIPRQKLEKAFHQTRQDAKSYGRFDLDVPQEASLLQFSIKIRLLSISLLPPSRAPKSLDNKPGPYSFSMRVQVLPEYEGSLELSCQYFHMPLGSKKQGLLSIYSAYYYNFNFHLYQSSCLLIFLYVSLFTDTYTFIHEDKERAASIRLLFLSNSY